MRHNRRNHPMTSMSPFGSFGGFGFGMPGFGMGFGAGSMFDELDAGFGGGSSIQTFSSSFSGSPGMAMRSSSTSTRFVNGKKITTKKVFDNGVETVTTYENDILKSQTVNGDNQAIQGSSSTGHQRLVGSRAGQHSSSHHNNTVDPRYGHGGVDARHGHERYAYKVRKH